MPGRPKTHQDTTPQHPNRLSAKALDLLRRITYPKGVIYADNENPHILKALYDRKLVCAKTIGDDPWTVPTDAGRALIESIGGKAK